MSESRGDRELHGGDVQELNHLSKEIEKMVEVMENVSVQLTWMSYDMVVLRTRPDEGESARRLEEEFIQCKNLLEDTRSAKSLTGEEFGDVGQISAATSP